MKYLVSAALGALGVFPLTATGASAAMGSAAATGQPSQSSGDTSSSSSGTMKPNQP